MARPIRLFISSSPDLVLEREMLGQTVAELPISIGAEIKHTPGAAEDLQAPLAFIEQCDLYLIVLGGDFAAPMGLEWQRALDTRRRMLAYRRRGPHSPSGRELLRRSNIAWTEIRSVEDLKVHVTRALAHFLLDNGEQFGLHLDEVEKLLAEIAEQKEEPAEPERRHGAGKSGVILGRSN